MVNNTTTEKYTGTTLISLIEGKDQESEKSTYPQLKLIYKKLDNSTVAKNRKYHN